MILGGPFLPHIEGILRSKAASMLSSVILASNIGFNSSIKGIINKNGIGLCQSCDIVIQNEEDDKPVSFKDLLFFYLKQEFHVGFLIYQQIVHINADC